MTNIQKASAEQKGLIANLMQLYLHDLSEFEVLDFDSQGRFRIDEYFDSYWMKPTRFPYVFFDGNTVVGFAFVRQVGPGAWSMAEFSILRAYRRRGIGKSVAHQIFSMHPGIWHVAQLQSNIPAQGFWRDVIHNYTNGKFDDAWSDVSPRGPMIRFKTPAEQGVSPDRSRSR